MPNRRGVIERNQLLLESAETRAARQVAQAYNQARRELLDLMIERWTGAATLTPSQQLDLLRRLNLLQLIDSRLGALEREVGLVLRDAVVNCRELALEQIGRELMLLPVELRPNLAQFTLIDFSLVEEFAPAALRDLANVRQATMLTLRRELQTGLLQGQGFPQLARRLMAATPTGEAPAVWRNGQLSADRLVRRVVVQANNMSKQSAMEAINRDGKIKVQKQWVASIGQRTTKTCLRLHGQIRDVDQPFDVEAEPRFARQLMTSPAHWNCRSSVVMYHPAFERGGLTTPNMRSSAAAELARRDE